MSNPSKHINTVLLVTSGLSVESAKIVADEINRLENEVGRLREALRKIADISQLTNVTFEVQAFTAADIAKAALKEDA